MIRSFSSIKLSKKYSKVIPRDVKRASVALLVEVNARKSTRRRCQEPLPSSHFEPRNPSGTSRKGISPTEEKAMPTTVRLC